MIDFVVTQKKKDFKILQLTDMQIIDASQRRFADRLCNIEIEKLQPDNMNEMLFDSMDNLIKETCPDLIVVTGDIIYGEFDDNGNSLKAFIDKMESYGIPWAPVWGNHDNESVLGVDWQCEQFTLAENCLFKKGSTVGCSNYIIGIKNENGKLIRLVYMMDSNGCHNASNTSILQGVRQVVGFTSQQTEWMRSTYAQICKEHNKTVPCFVCFHIEPIDFIKILENKGYYDTNNFKKHDIAFNGEDFGQIHESICAGEAPVSVLSTFKEIHVDGVFFGHSHINNASIVDHEIRWTWGLKTGKYDYHEDDKLGGTLITVSNDGRNFTICHKKSQ